MRLGQRHRGRERRYPVHATATKNVDAVKRFKGTGCVVIPGFGSLTTMHIHEIQIRNVRSLRSHRWSFAPTRRAGWHVVLGDNGSGKSSFLRAIALAIVGARQAEWLRQSWGDWLTQGKRRGFVRIEIDGDRAGTSPTRPSYGGSDARGKAFETGVEFERDERTDTVDVKRLSEGNSSILPHALRGNNPHFLSPLVGFEEDRDWFFSSSFGPVRRFTGRNHGSPRAPPAVSRHLPIFEEDMVFAKSLDWLQELKFRALENDPEGSLLERLMQFVNGTGLLPDGVRIDNVTSRRVTFRDANGADVSAMDLSDGYRSILSMTFELIRQMVVTFGPDGVFSPGDPTRIAPKGVVIVDEIDAHLHPTWQARIGRWFCTHFPNVQFIVSTHSPFVCRSAENGSVYLLPRPGSGEKGGRLKRDTLLRLVYGTVLDAYGTEAFYSDAVATRSPKSREMHQRLAFLNNREVLTGLSPDEEREQDRLRRKLPSVSTRND